MSEQNSKRVFTPEVDLEAFDVDIKRQELETSKKSSTKPGRKPIETEPKNKRTAQNRAAQRAFRERKERKMKELEEKVTQLEDEKDSINTESEFLRMQVQILMSELAKHRGTADLSDLKLPTVSQVTPQAKTTPLPQETKVVHGSISSNSSSTTPSDDPSPETTFNPQPFSFEFPWSRKNSFGKSPLQFGTPATTNSNSNSNSNNPGLTSDTSTTASSQSSPLEFTNPDEHNLTTFPTKKSSLSDQNNEFKFDDHFDEGVSEFCVELNSACGTKQCPVPKSKTDSRISTPFNDATYSLTQDLDQHVNVLDSNNQPLSFLGNDFNTGITFDQSLAFGTRDDNLFGLFDPDNENDNQEEDPLKGLISEESRYDPFGLFENIPLNTPSSIASQSQYPPSSTASQYPHPSSNTTTPSDYTPAGQQPNPVKPEHVPTTTVNSSGPIDHAALLDEIVPNKDSRLLKCTEIWDRVTSHPRYSDIDIDGLCAELRAKAKCSDKGVVIDYDDVRRVIHDNLPLKN